MEIVEGGGRYEWKGINLGRQNQIRNIFYSETEQEVGSRTKGGTMQIKKEMKHDVGIGLFIEFWNPLPMHPTPPLPLLTVSEYPFLPTFRITT